MSILLVSVICAGAACFNLLLAACRDSGRSIDERLATFVRRRPPRGMMTGSSSLLFGIPLRLGRAMALLPPVKGLVRLFSRHQDADALRKLLLAGDLDERMSIEELTYARLGWAVVMGAAALPGVLSMGNAGLFMLVAGLFIGFRIPISLVSSIAEGRKNQIKKAMIDAVDLMAVGVEAGMSLDKVVRVYAERFDGILAQEFKKAFAKLDLGKPRREVLLGLSEKTDVDDLKILVSSILQAEKLGTPLSYILTELSADIKIRHRQWAREASAKAPIKMLFPLAGLILPALFIVLLGPVALRVVQGAQ